MSLLTEEQMLRAFPAHMRAVRVPPGWKEFALNIEAATLTTLRTQAQPVGFIRHVVYEGIARNGQVPEAIIYEGCKPNEGELIYTTPHAEATQDQAARGAIDGAIAYGRMGINKPEEGHWLAEYWAIGQQLAELGKTSTWDNQTPADAATLVATDALSTGMGIMRIDPAAALIEAARPILTRASAATVAEPSDPLDEERKQVNALFKRIEGESIEEHLQRFAEGMDAIQAAQQQAEPGADERVKRVLKSIAARRTTLADLSERGIQTQAITATLDDCADLLRSLAAQSGQRAGVAEGWKLVPEQPTEAMVNAAIVRRDDWADIHAGPKSYPYAETCGTWRAMLAAAPTQQQEAN